MNAIVIKTFKDKYTNEVFPAGAEITVTQERAEEILAAGKYIVIPSGQQEPLEQQEELSQQEPTESEEQEVAPAQPKRRGKTK